MGWLNRRSASRAARSTERLIQGLDFAPVLAEHLVAAEPIARQVAAHLNARRVDAVSWDPERASLVVHAGGESVTVAVGDGQPAEQVVSMLELEPVSVVAVSGGGRVMLEFSSRSWTYTIVASPALPG